MTNVSEQRPVGEAIPPGLTADKLETPVTVVDLDRLERNIERMAALAKDNGVKLRPMIKTHKSPAIAQMQMKAGAVGVLAASIDEAELMAAAGIEDVTLAYPFIGPAQMARIARLMQTGSVRLTLSVDSAAAVERLASGLSEGGGRPGGVPVLILIDSGGRRLGVQPEDALLIARAITAAPGLRLAGVATHPGHAYGATTPELLDGAAAEETGAVLEAARRLREAGFDVATVAVGSTPTASRSARVPGITEMRPGNYVFHDAMQIGLGVVTEEDCALQVIGTVLSRPTAETAVIDVGSKMLSSDQGAHGLSVTRGYGRIVGEPDMVVERVSEELAVVSLPADHGLAVGDRVRVIPNHACTAANLVDVLVGLRGDAVEELLEVKARRRNFRL